MSERLYEFIIHADIETTKAHHSASFESVADLVRWLRLFVEADIIGEHRVTLPASVSESPTPTFSDADLPHQHLNVRKGKDL